MIFSKNFVLTRDLCKIQQVVIKDQAESCLMRQSWQGGFSQ